MSNKQVCLLCNAELSFLSEEIDLPAEYGYLCGSCRVDTLKMRDYFQPLELQREAILNLGKPWKPFSRGKQAFPADLMDRSEPISGIQQQRLYNDTPSITTETFKPEPISANQVMAEANEIVESYMPTPEQKAKDFQDMAAAHKALMNNEPISGKLEAIKLVKIIKPKTYTTKNKDNEVGLICSRIIGCVNENKEVLPDLFAQPTEILCTGTDIEVSDGYHTMTELYEHRNLLWVTLCRALSLIMDETGGWDNTWTIYITQKSEEWFVLGVIDTVYDKSLKGHTDYQLSYHLPIKYLDQCLEFARENPDLKFDGHTSDDVLERLKELI